MNKKRILSSITAYILSLSACTIAVNGAVHPTAEHFLGGLNPGGTHSSFVYWNDLGVGNPTGTPAAGTGTTTPLSPGFRATGYYSFSSDYGASFSSGETSFGITSVSLHLVLMPPEIPAEDIFTFKIDDWSYASEITDYQGGPVLSYYVDGIRHYYQGQASTIWYDPNGIFDPSGPAGGGTYYHFSWSWDLSLITGNITQVELETPFPVHTSVVGAAINVVPEPGTYAAIFGGIGLVFLLIRRRKSLKVA